MRKSRGLQCARPAFSLPGGAENLFADRIQVRINEPKGDAHVARSFTPVVLKSFELEAHAQWGARRIRGGAKIECDILWPGRKPQFLVGVERHGLAVDAQGVNFQTMLGLSACHALDRVTPTPTAEKAAEAQTCYAERGIHSVGGLTRASGRQAHSAPSERRVKANLMVNLLSIRHPRFRGYRTDP